MITEEQINRINRLYDNLDNPYVSFLAILKNIISKEPKRSLYFDEFIRINLVTKENGKQLISMLEATLKAEKEIKSRQIKQTYAFFYNLGWFDGVERIKRQAKVNEFLKSRSGFKNKKLSDLTIDELKKTVRQLRSIKSNYDKNAQSSKVDLFNLMNSKKVD